MAEKARVRAAVHRRYPSIGQESPARRSAPRQRRYGKED